MQGTEQLVDASCPPRSASHECCAASEQRYWPFGTLILKEFATLKEYPSARYSTISLVPLQPPAALLRTRMRLAGHAADLSGSHASILVAPKLCVLCAGPTWHVPGMVHHLPLPSSLLVQCASPAKQMTMLEWP